MSAMDSNNTHSEHEVQTLHSAHDHSHGHDHAHDHDEEHEHHDTFITKYIFTQDHKMIAKQFLLTAVLMAVIAMLMSIVFRLQLAWPGKSFPILEPI